MKWISVKERLPEIEVEVLVFCEDENTKTVFRFKGNKPIYQYKVKN